MLAAKLALTAAAGTHEGRPSAATAADGSLEPLAHAVPVARQIPAKSAAITMACRSQPRNAIVVMCGPRSAPCPTT